MLSAGKMKIARQNVTLKRSNPNFMYLLRGKEKCYNSMLRRGIQQAYDWNWGLKFISQSFRAMGISFSLAWPIWRGVWVGPFWWWLKCLLNWFLWIIISTGSLQRPSNTVPIINRLEKLPCQLAEHFCFQPIKTCLGNIWCLHDRLLLLISMILNSCDIRKQICDGRALLRTETLPGLSFKTYQRKSEEEMNSLKEQRELLKAGNKPASRHLRQTVWAKARSFGADSLDMM